MSAALDLSPAPGAAPLHRQVWAQALMEARLMLRNAEQIGVAIVIPVLALVGGVAAADRLGLDLAHRPVDVLTPGVLALGIISTAFTALTIATGFERRYGLIKRLGASPLPRGGFLAAKLLALLAVQAIQMVVISAVALVLGWEPPSAQGLASAAGVAVLGSAAFAAWGLLLAGTVRAEATLALANLAYLLMMAAGAVVFPAANHGAFAGVVTRLPSGALGEGMRGALLDGHLGMAHLVVLAVWALIGAVLAARTFKWE